MKDLQSPIQRDAMDSGQQTDTCPCCFSVLGQHAGAASSLFGGRGGGGLPLNWTNWWNEEEKTRGEEKRRGESMCKYSDVLGDQLKERIKAPFPLL